MQSVKRTLILWRFVLISVVVGLQLKEKTLKILDKCTPMPDAEH
jgi:hypothetical protein